MRGQQFGIGRRNIIAMTIKGSDHEKPIVVNGRRMGGGK
jgi:hypothetical protein